MCSDLQTLVVEQLMYLLDHTNNSIIAAVCLVTKNQVNGKGDSSAGLIGRAAWWQGRAEESCLSAIDVTP